MPDILLSGAIAAASAILALLEPRIEGLIAPVDSGAVAIKDLDAMEVRTINWVLPDLVQYLHGSGETYTPRDIERIEDSYNYNLAQLDKARFSIEEFDRA